jgi:ABC-type nitrate/sulfonate/bicarbonate transport system substrate-binding protein
VVHPLSSHHILLRQWLQASGIHPEHGARIVVVPPAQIHRHLAAGNLDGFCVGEPWNSLAVLRKTGWCVATSADLAPGHPEKVVLVTESFAEKRAAEHLALVAALNEACAFCEEAANRTYVAEVLARGPFAGTPPESLTRSLVGPFVYGDGRTRDSQGLHIFSGDRANEPTGDKLSWVLNGLESTGILASGELPSAAASARWFRPDLYRKALPTSSPQELATHHS